MLPFGPAMADAAQAPLDLDVEDFPAQQPHINGKLFVEHARVVLHAAGDSRPVPMVVYHDEKELAALARFAPPDPRSSHSVNVNDLIEKAAIVIAGLLMRPLLGLRFLEVVQIGDRVDYFLVDESGEHRSIAEIGGTRDSANKLQYLRQRKIKQLSESRYRKAPHRMTGYAVTSRFIDPLGAAVDTLPPATPEEEASEDA